MSNADLDAVKELGLTKVNKYQRHADYVKMELNQLYDKIFALAIFVRYSQKVYNSKELDHNINFKQDIDPK